MARALGPAAESVGFGPRAATAACAGSHPHRVRSKFDRPEPGCAPAL